VAEEEQVVLGGDGEGVAHEGRRVDAEGEGHWAGDPVIAVIVVSMGVLRGRVSGGCRDKARGRVREGGEDNVQVGALLGVHDGCDGNAEVGDGTPEICGEALLVMVLCFVSSAARSGATVARGRQNSNWHLPGQPNEPKVGRADLRHTHAAFYESTTIHRRRMHPWTRHSQGLGVVR
jgi:hypothetical protein